VADVVLKVQSWTAVMRTSSAWSTYEFITQPMDRENIPGAVWRRFDLLPQCGNVHIDGASCRHGVVTPDLVQKLIPGENRPTVLNQVAKESYFACLQFNRLAIPLDHRSPAINADRVELIDFRRLCWFCSATELGFDARLQLNELERLDHVIIGPKLQPDDAIGHLSSRRQHDDWRVNSLLPKVTAHIKTIATR